MKNSSIERFIEGSIGVTSVTINVTLAKILNATLQSRINDHCSSVLNATLGKIINATLTLSATLAATLTI